MNYNKNSRFFNKIFISLDFGIFHPLFPATAARRRSRSRHIRPSFRSTGRSRQGGGKTTWIHSFGHVSGTRQGKQKNENSGHFRHKSLMTSAAMIKPATGGTNAVEPGISRRTVHLRVPGGQMQ